MTSRVEWLIRLRWLAALGVLTVGLAAYHLTPVRFNLACVFVVSAGIALYNAALYLLARQRVWDKAPEQAIVASRYVIHVQIIADLVCLAVLVQCTGGLINPFVIFMVFHMALAGIMLPRPDALLQACVASVLLAILAVLDAKVPGSRGMLVGYPLEIEVGGYPLAGHPLYAGSTWLVLTITFFLTVYFTSGISQKLDDAYRELSVAYEELHKREAAKSQFLQVVAHEMRSPLAAVTSLLDLLDSEEPADTMGRHVHQRVKARCDAMMDMIDDLLRLAHVRAGGALAGTPEFLDVAQMVEATCAEFTEEAAGKAVRLETNLTEASGLTVRAVRRDFRDLIANLLGNAIKYTPTNGYVRVRVNRRDGQVLLQVSDTGIGIPAGEQEHLFNEFFRASNARRVTAHSSGLGLSIVKSLVEKLSGEIRFQSREGEGTTFEVLLPMAGPPPEQDTLSSRRP
jgi:signal transduction histidine kinase